MQFLPDWKPSIVKGCSVVTHIVGQSCSKLPRAKSLNNKRPHSGSVRETRSHSARKALWDANENNKASVAHITVLRLGCELQQFELQSKNIVFLIS